MHILSRNVNGIRSIVQKGFIDTISTLNPDVICIQEPKAFLNQCPKEILDYNYHITRHTGNRPGYAGTAILSKRKPESVKTIFDQKMFHEDGRLTQIDLGGLIIINVYFPNGGERADGTEMLSYKLHFYDKFMHYLTQYKNTPHIVIGDFNICHTEYDIARPKENQNSIGFLPIERAKVTEFLSQGYQDAFRYFEPHARDQYTRRSYRANARKRNIGRRIDYACISNSALSYLRQFRHHQDILGSDHCPLSVFLKE